MFVPNQRDCGCSKRREQRIRGRIISAGEIERIGGGKVAERMQPLPRLLQAANTLVRTDAGWRAENTDVTGVGMALQLGGVERVPHATIIGVAVAVGGAVEVGTAVLVAVAAAPVGVAPLVLVALDVAGGVSVSVAVTIGVFVGGLVGVAVAGGPERRTTSLPVPPSYVMVNVVLPIWKTAPSGRLTNVPLIGSAPS